MRKSGAARRREWRAILADPASTDEQRSKAAANLRAARGAKGASGAERQRAWRTILADPTSTTGQRAHAAAQLERVRLTRPSKETYRREGAATIVVAIALSQLSRGSAGMVWFDQGVLPQRMHSARTADWHRCEVCGGWWTGEHTGCGGTPIFPPLTMRDASVAASMSADSREQRP